MEGRALSLASELRQKILSVRPDLMTDLDGPTRNGIWYLDIVETGNATSVWVECHPTKGIGISLRTPDDDGFDSLFATFCTPDPFLQHARSYQDVGEAATHILDLFKKVQEVT